MLIMGITQPERTFYVFICILCNKIKIIPNLISRVGKGKRIQSCEFKLKFDKKLYTSEHLQIYLEYYITI